MFSSIKDRLLNVGKNVVLFTISNNSEKTQRKPTPVDSNAGSNILTHFQNEWENLHRNNEENAKKMEEIAEDIAKVTKRIDNDKDNLALMTYIWTNTNLKDKVTNCKNVLDKLYEDFEKVELELVQLENVIECVEFEKMKRQHSYHLQQYKSRKLESLETYEVTLKADYKKKIEEYELKKKEELQERQQVFLEAFKTDLEAFKSFGTIPKLDLPKKQPSALLEEIQVDYDQKELDQFFNDDHDNPL